MSKQRAGRRVLSLLLALVMLLGLLPGGVQAADPGIGSRFGNQYDEVLLAEMQELCGEEYDAVTVLDNLYSAGLVDETGHMTDEPSFNVDGVTVSRSKLEELAAGNHQDGDTVVLDGQELTWGQLRELLGMADALQVVYDYMENPVEWDDQRLAALRSLADYMSADGDAGAVMPMALTGDTSAAAPRAQATLGGVLKDFTTDDASDSDYYLGNGGNNPIGETEPQSPPMSSGYIGESYSGGANFGQAESGNTPEFFDRDWLLMRGGGQYFLRVLVAPKFFTDPFKNVTAVGNNCYSIDGNSTTFLSSNDYDINIASNTNLVVLGICDRNGASTAPIDSNTVTWKYYYYQCKDAKTNSTSSSATVTKITIPSGKYGPGQHIPIIVTLSSPVVVDDNMVMTVNGVELQAMKNTDKSQNAVTNQLVFNYTVKEMDTGTIKVESLKGDGATKLTVPESTITNAANNNCVLVTPKGYTLKYSKVSGKFDDSSVNPKITIRIDLPEEASQKDWIARDAIQINGAGDWYLGSMYLTLGTMDDYIHYPFKIILDPTDPDLETPVALECTYTQPETLYYGDAERFDLLVFALDEDYDNSQGTKFFDTTTNDAGETVYANNISFKYKGDAGWGGKDSVTLRHDLPYMSPITNKYLIWVGTRPQMPTPLAQENVELVYDWDQWSDGKNPPKYDASVSDMALTGLPTISYKFTGLDPELRYYTSASQFNWVPTDNSSAITVLESKVKNEDGATVKQLTLVPTGAEGAVDLTLQALNGKEYVQGTSLNIKAPQFNFHAGTEPFVAFFGSMASRMVLRGGSLGVAFTSNLTARNADALGDEAAVTTFTLDLYACNEMGVVPEGARPVGTWTVDSTQAATKGMITIPEGVLMETQANGYSYVARVSGHSEALDKDFSADCKIKVVSPPVKATLETLDSYSITKTQPLELSWVLEDLDTSASAHAEAYLTLRRASDGSSSGPINVLDKSSAADGLWKGSHSFGPLEIGPGLLKESYLVTLTARNKPEDDWSADSCVITVYNSDFLRIVIDKELPGEQAFKLTNEAEIKNMVTTGVSGAVTAPDFDAFRQDLSLYTTAEVNHRDSSDAVNPKYTYGILSDQIAWESYTKQTTDHSFNSNAIYYVKQDGAFVVDESVTRDNFLEKVAGGLYLANGNAAGLNYKRGGFYSDIYTYNYSSYNPDTEFMLVGNANGETTLTATHARTGEQTQVDVTVETLRNKLYLFSVLPKGETRVEYTNGKNEDVTLTTDENGQLIVYEPEGIATDVRFKAVTGDNVGILARTSLESGERDATRGLAYPLNVCRMGPVSEMTLYVMDSSGAPYSGTITLRGGVYVNGRYAKGTAFGTSKNVDNMLGGTVDHVINIAPASKGKVKLYFDSASFRVDELEMEPGDEITYVFEVQANGYAPYTFSASSKDLPQNGPQTMKAIVNLKPVADADKGVPTVYSQHYAYTQPGFTKVVDDVTYYTDKLGPSNQFNDGVLTSQLVFWNAKTVTDEESGSPTENYQSVPNMTFGAQLEDVNGVASPGQMVLDENHASVVDPLTITNLEDLKTAQIYCYPFSTYVLGTSRYVMNRENLMDTPAADGESWLKTDEVKDVSMQFYIDGMRSGSYRVPFRLTNLIGKEDPVQNGNIDDMRAQVEASVTENLNVGSMMGGMDGGEFLEMGMKFFSGVATGGKATVGMLIAPTLDPTTYKIVVSMDNGDMDDEEDDGDGLSADFTDEESMKAIQDAITGGDDDDDEDDDEPMGATKVEFHFKGAATALARYSLNDAGEIVWDIQMTGGSFDGKLSIKKEWKFNFFCGPIPVFVDFSAEMGLKAGIGLYSAVVPEENYKTYTEFLTTLGADAGIEAFAGVGFDATIIAVKLGIFGSVGAGITYKMLASEYWADHPDDTLYDLDGFNQGGDLNIHGEIGIRLEVKILFIKYRNTFASTGFDKHFYTGQYEDISDYWTGLTENGGIYTASRTPDGRIAYSVQDTGEDRSYLSLFNRSYLNTVSGPFTSIMENANPYAIPTVSPDGSLLVYVSDLGSDSAETVGLGYILRGVDGNYTVAADGEAIVPTDLPAYDIASLDVAQAGGKYYVTWVAQTDAANPAEVEYQFVPKVDEEGNPVLDENGQQIIEKIKVPGTGEAGEPSPTELTQVLGSAEVYLSIYDPANVDSPWITTNLTGDPAGQGNADFAARVAANGDKYAVAYRRGVGSSPAAPHIFDVSDRILVSLNGAAPVTAYNGSKGAPLSVDAAMLSDGSVLVAYAVNCGEIPAVPDENGLAGDPAINSEVFYTLVNSDGTVESPVRLTNNQTPDENLQVASVKLEDNSENFLLAWYGQSQDGEWMKDDAQFSLVNAQGLMDAGMLEHAGSAVGVGSSFQLVSGTQGSFDDIALMWNTKVAASDPTSTEAHDVIYAAKFFGADEMGYPQGVSSAQTVGTLPDNSLVNTMQGFADSGTFKAVMTVDNYGTNVVDVTTISDQTGTTEISTQYLRSDLSMVGYEPESSVSVAVRYDKASVLPGFQTPITFSVKNTGTEPITKVELVLSGVAGSTLFTLPAGGCQPGDTATHTVYYQLPDDSVPDLTYTLKASTGAGGSEEVADYTNAAGESIKQPQGGVGKVRLNLPDLEVSDIRLTKEADGKRGVRMTVANTTGIPLAGTGKTVRVALYADAEHTEGNLLTGTTVNITGDDLELVDLGVYVYQGTLDALELANKQCSDAQIADADGELPDVDYKVYASAEILYPIPIGGPNTPEVQKESVTSDNSGLVTYRSLLSKADNQLITVGVNDPVLLEAGDEGYDAGKYMAGISVGIQNNSMKEQEIAAILVKLYDLDENGEKRLLDTVSTMEKDASGNVKATTLTKEQNLQKVVLADTTYDPDPTNPADDTYSYIPYIKYIETSFLNANTELTLDWNYQEDGADKGTYKVLKGRLGKAFNLSTHAEYTAPERTGYELKGWYTDKECTDVNLFVDNDDFWMDKDALTVYAKWAVKPPEIATQPESVTKEYDGASGISTAVTPVEGMTYEYQWYYKGAGDAAFAAVNGETSADLSLKSVADSGAYYCEVVAVDAGGKKSTPTKTNEVSMTISKAGITVAAATGSWPYDGEEHTLNTAGDYTVTKTTGGGAFTFPTGEGFSDVKITGAITNAGTAPNVLEEYTFNENTDADNYEVTKQNGTLTVTKIDWTGGKDVSHLVLTGRETENEAIKLPVPAPGGAYGAVTVTSNEKNLIQGTPVLSTEGGNHFLTINTASITNDSEDVTTKAVITIPVTNATNHKDYNVVVTVEAVDKYIVEISGVSISGKVYDGDGVEAPAYTGVHPDTGEPLDQPLAIRKDTGAFIDLSDDSYYEYRYINTADNTYTLGVLNTPSAAGSYTLRISVAQSNPEYTGFTELPFTISQKELTVTGVSAADRTYIPADKLAVLSGGALSGVITGDDVTLDASSARGEMADELVGSGKPVTITGFVLGGADKGNYTLSQPTGVTVSITKATPHVKINPSATAAYGAAVKDMTLTGGTVQHSAAKSDEVTGGWTFSAEESDIPEVGSTTEYTATFTPSGSSANNYTTVTAQVTPVITKGVYDGTPNVKTVNIQIQKASASTGTLTASDFFTTLPTGAVLKSVSGVSGSVLASDPTVSDGKLSYASLVNIETEDLTETYTVTIETKNYQDITATLIFKSVKRTPVTISGVTLADKPYDGSAIHYSGTPAATTADGAVADIPAGGYDYQWTKSDGTVLSGAPKDAGSYRLMISVKDDNDTYAGQVELGFTISRKAVTVGPRDEQITEGQELPAITLVYTGLVGGETLTPNQAPMFTGLPATGGNAGVFAVTWANAEATVFTGGANTDAANYEITKNTGCTLTINSRPSGGGGGGAPVTMPESGNSSNVAFDAKMDGDKVTITGIDQKSLKEALEKGESILIDVSGLENEISRAAIPADVLYSISSAGGAGLELALSTGSVAFDSAALKAVVAQSGGNTVSLSLQKAVPSSLTGHQRAAADGKDALVVSVTLEGGKAITDFKGGMVKITLPYSLEPGQSPEGLSVYYLAPDGTQEELECTYDAAKKTVSFYVSHFSVYMVAYEGAVVEWVNPFTDVKEGDWFYEAVKLMNERGLMGGTSGTTFSPMVKTTRSMIVTILYRMEDSPAAAGGGAFPDVEQGAFYTDAVAWASQNGIVTGYSDGRFGPDDLITREQLAAILYRYAQFKGHDLSAAGDLSGFTDQPSGWAAEAMKWAVGNGIITGKGSGTLDPEGSATRAEAAVMLQRFLKAQ